MIFEAIAAIKIANEAIGAVKELCGHIQSVGEMGPQLTKLADSKEQIQKKAEEGDMDAFFALEDIRRQEAEIKQMFIYQGRAGLWDDYQKFMQTRKELREKERQRAEAKKLAQRKAIQNGFLYAAAGISILGVVGGAVALVLWFISLRGR
jgi:CHASE3 domain sensor protein